MSQTSVMVGICAYNEENNIERLLQNLVFEQNIPKESRILVVCSGCTDRTPQIVAGFQKRDPRIELVIEKVRRGKSSALNRIFRTAKINTDILVLVNADAVPEKGSITKLISKFTRPEVAAAFAQPVPQKNSNSSCYGVTRLIWRLHHIISLLDTPKLSGELCALQAPYLQEIPENTATDEPYIEGAIKRRRQNTVYVPEAVVYIRCPTSVVDIIKQRKRIWIGHMQLQKTTGYKVSTSNFSNILRAIFKLRRNETIYVLPGGFLELIAYLEAKLLFGKGAIPFAWEPIKTTKASV